MFSHVSTHRFIVLVALFLCSGVIATGCGVDCDVPPIEDSVWVRVLDRDHKPVDPEGLVVEYKETKDTEWLPCKTTTNSMNMSTELDSSYHAYCGDGFPGTFQIRARLGDDQGELDGIQVKRVGECNVTQIQEVELVLDHTIMDD